MINWLRVALVLLAIAIMTLFLAPLQLLALRFDWRLRRRLPRVWHSAACRLIGIRIRSHGRLESHRPLMIAANHASWKDILVLGALADVVFIAKTEVASWPVFGLLARLQKSIFVMREQRRRTGDQVSEIAERMADGEIVVLFPEGTTSDGNRVLDVKTSLFGAAAAALPLAPQGVVYVQPVAIAYTRVHGMPMGRYHRPIAGWPGDVGMVPHLLGVLQAGAIDVDVSFGEAVEYREGSNRKQVAGQVEKRMRCMLLDHLRGRLWS
ncbi:MULTISPECIES: lysophospholipid acyltransferase family protein [Alphaproteobacteria]|uniref:1-acyl-sn-glycerol-3-phosphate acyltransferase n=2 Tax=Alphaproteobacteria TaxID=28211 RepID=A0A512HDV3_9HYPH|nr:MULTISPECIES: lysophospholipid acyltransferase family protein [Alphaproteobacteria]GEO83634.1 1-acyl-sn-glycerol-3-phosphate acyltransferase [Ciceribacter naphthalenivorans]GLR24214.1 1-acyl-sn-glycerol-3-phosphate acyltransferase [Ciceribacter naphthalenivorans]GLT07070.1 1-acyl-sn-glycerol-3-phosphate acyltransferase [Sphingomonas psychrolutea]